MKNFRQVDQALRNVAERHPDDIIANRASALAVKLESLGKEFGTTMEDITESDRLMMQYVLGWVEDNKESIDEQYR